MRRYTESTRLQFATFVIVALSLSTAYAASPRELRVSGNDADLLSKALQSAGVDPTPQGVISITQLRCNGGLDMSGPRCQFTKVMAPGVRAGLPIGNLSGRDANWLKGFLDSGFRQLGILPVDQINTRVAVDCDKNAQTCKFTFTSSGGAAGQIGGVH